MRVNVAVCVPRRVSPSMSTTTSPIYSIPEEDDLQISQTARLLANKRAAPMGGSRLFVVDCLLYGRQSCSGEAAQQLPLSGWSNNSRYPSAAICAYCISAQSTCRYVSIGLGRPGRINSCRRVSISRLQTRCGVAYVGSEGVVPGRGGSVLLLCCCCCRSTVLSINLLNLSTAPATASPTVAAWSVTARGR